MSTERTLPPGGQPVDAARSTMIAASLIALRELGLDARYYAALSEVDQARMRSLGVGEWLPIDLVAAHYAAYDILDLDTPTIDAIATITSRRAHGTLLRAFGAVVRRVGALTPSMLAGQLPKMWERTFRGGTMVIEQLGGNALRVRTSGLRAIGGSRYFREAMTRHYQNGVALFSKECRAEPLVVSSPDHYTVRLTWK